MNVFRKDNQRQINIKTCIEYCEINGDFSMKEVNYDVSMSKICIINCMHL